MGKSKKAKKAKKAKQQAASEAAVDARSEEGSSDVAQGAAPAAVTSKMKRKEYEREMRRLQGELVAMQEWVKATGAKVCIVFEGLDSAGKGGTIRRITERTSPRVFKHIALPAPTDREKSQMYIQRYIAHFPAAGEVAIFDRSWYNRAGVELVMGYCTPEQSERFLAMAPAVEKAMVDNGIILHQVLAQRQRRRADPAAREPDRRPAQDLEALSHGPEVLQPPLRLLPGPGRHDRRHRHRMGAVVRRAQRRQEARPAQHHLPSAEPDPLRAAGAPRRRRCPSRRAPTGTLSRICPCATSPRSSEVRLLHRERGTRME